jgi:hypothetical protein
LARLSDRLAEVPLGNLQRRDDLRAEIVSTRDDKQAAGRRLTDAREAVSQAVDDRRSASADLQVAMDRLALALSPRTTDADLIRIAALAVIPVIALLGAVALVAPRPTSSLEYSSGRRQDDPQPGGGTAGNQRSGAAAAPRSGEPAKSTFAAREPVVTQAGLTAAALIAGLFGIQNTEGVAEAAINASLPVVPLIGAFLARRQVWATANLAPGVR